MTNDISAAGDIPPINDRSAPPTEHHLPSLPAGWEQNTTLQGRVFYANHNTHTTTWNDPRLPDLPNLETDSVPVSLDGPSLPRGWEARRNTNRNVFFLNHNTLTTTWDDPRTTVQGNESEQTSLNVPPLPRGWEEMRSAKGVPYFVDHNTKSNTWIDPRESM
jgi:E3 ubiquitin-protein ligase NEDD4